MRKEYGMPKTEQDAWSEIFFPIRVGRYDLVHESEKTRWVVPDLHINIEPDMSVLGLIDRC